MNSMDKAREKLRIKLIPADGERREQSRIERRREKDARREELRKKIRPDLYE